MSVLEKYQRIVWWMQQYIVPILEVIRVDGPMQATFAEVEAVLESATTNALVISAGTAERNLRLVRVTRRHALNVFEQSGKEISPLYQTLARSSNLATGAAWALDRLRLGTLEGWMREAVVGIFSLRQQDAFSDKAIIGAIERCLNNPPKPPPTVSRSRTGDKPAAMQQREWLNLLPDEVATQLPVEDVLGWLVKRHPEMETDQLLAGFSTLFFHERFRAEFTGLAACDYETPHHLIHAHPVRLGRHFKMNYPPHLQEIFEKLKNGYHISPEDDVLYSALNSERYDDYAGHFAGLGIILRKHEHDFFYFEPDAEDKKFAATC